MSNSPWRVNILTLFPEIFPGPLSHSVTGKALDKGSVKLVTHQIRDYAFDNYKTVDDSPYGGGNGMVMKADVLANAIDNCFNLECPIFYLSPKGKKFTQKVASEMVLYPEINLLCGRFEGVDERLFLEYKIDQISMGDFVLTSGDIAALPFLDSCIRILPNVLDDGQALLEESFGLDDKYKNLLEYPHYTRPQVWRGHEVPDVLISGHHEKIKDWRLKQAEKITKIARPDLWDQYNKGEKK